MKKSFKHTPEMRKHLKEMLLSYKKTEKFKKAQKEALAKMKGKNHPSYGMKRTDESKERMSVAHKGVRRNISMEVRKKIGDAHRGKKNVNWKGGVTPENEKGRKCIEYYGWRRDVFHRDRFTCRVCLSKGYVQANHIYPFRSHIELRYDVNNGITLCVSCHKFIFKREHLFIKFFQGILENGLNSAKTSNETTPSQQERLRKALWACVTVRGE